MRLLKTICYLNCLTSLKQHIFPNVFKREHIIFKRALSSVSTLSEITSRDDYFVLEKSDCGATVLIIPMFKDNYSYLFFDKREEGIVVDPSDYKKVKTVAEKENVKIQNVLCTHKHSDHSAGNFYFFKKGINVYGIKEADNPYINQNVISTKQFHISNFQITTFISNFHAQNHVSYLVKNVHNNLKQLFFTGDFLFSSGIGRNFQHKNEDLYNSTKAIDIIDKDNTYVFCGHEYTASNLQFALSVDSNNDDLKKYYEHVQLIRKNGKPTIPTLLAQEYLYNPFLRYNQESIKKSIEKYAQKNKLNIQKPMDYLIILRIMKDNFVSA